MQSSNGRRILCCMLCVAYYCITYGSDYDLDESTLQDVMWCDVELHVPMPTDVNEQPAAAAGAPRDQLTEEQK